MPSVVTGYHIVDSSFVNRRMIGRSHSLWWIVIWALEPSRPEVPGSVLSSQHAPLLVLKPDAKLTREKEKEDVTKKKLTLGGHGVAYSVGQF